MKLAFFDTKSYDIPGFDRYGIPYYMDRTESIASMPLVRFIQHAAGALTAGFDRAEVLSFLKCGMTDLGLEELDAFESYSLVWNIDREGFFTPFTQNPAGFADREMTEGEKAELSKAESVRELCVSLLSAFRKEGEEGSWPRAVLKLLTDLSLPERLSRKILSLQQQGRQQPRQPAGRNMRRADFAQVLVVKCFGAGNVDEHFLLGAGKRLFVLREFKSNGKRGFAQHERQGGKIIRHGAGGVLYGVYLRNFKIFRKGGFVHRYLIARRVGQHKLKRKRLRERHRFGRALFHHIDFLRGNKGGGEKEKGKEYGFFHAIS